MFNGDSLKKRKESDVVKTSSAQTSRAWITPLPPPAGNMDVISINVGHAFVLCIKQHETE